MTALGLLLLALGLWVSLRQKERAYVRRRPSSAQVYTAYRKDLLGRMVDVALRAIAVLLVISCLTLLALVFEPVLALILVGALPFGLLTVALWP